MMKFLLIFILLISSESQASTMKKSDGWPDGFFTSKPHKPSNKSPNNYEIERMISSQLKKELDARAAMEEQKDNEIEYLKQRNRELEIEYDQKEKKLIAEQEEYIKNRQKSYLFRSFDKTELLDKEEAKKVYLGKSIKIFEASPALDLNMVITSEKFIPAVMLTPVNSEISSVATATVERNVLGTHGNNILIPAGSKIVGEFASVKAKGARRMAIIWKRILTPQGVNIIFDGTAHDKAGYSGIVSQRDTRRMDRYGAALVMSLINTAAQLSIDADNTAQAAAATSFVREMGTLTGTILKENLELAPIIIIAQGERFNIYPRGDILFSQVDEETIKAEYVNIAEVAKNGK